MLIVLLVDLYIIIGAYVAYRCCLGMDYLGESMMRSILLQNHDERVVDVVCSLYYRHRYVTLLIANIVWPIPVINDIRNRIRNLKK